ncbi:MAG: VWA domain-containing protein [Anaerolineae bacterium]|nr:VWA domain-containing protein [Anaerolineae bacterium]
MSFIAPLAVLLLALAAPILLLYMLRLRRREVPVSSTMLWQQLLRDREANAPWQRLRRNLLLILQLIILAALVLALMRPYVEVPSLATGRTALIIDASASMNATDARPTRFEAAKSEALDIVGTLGQDDTLAIIRAGETPEMVVSYTGDRDRLSAAIRDLQPGSGAADWNAAFTLAAAGAQGAENFSIILVGDGGLPEDMALSGFGAVQFVPVGGADSNTGIVALATGSDPVAGPQIYARIANYGAQPTEVILTITLDGDLFTAAPYTVPPQDSTDAVITGLPLDFHSVEAKLVRPSGSRAPDYLPTDDTAWAIFNPASAGRAVIFSQGNRFLEQGLTSLPDWRVFRGDLTRGIPAEPFDLYVFDGWLPPQLPAANVLIVNPPEDAPALAGLLTVGPESRRATITGVKPDDARTRYLRFSDVNVLRFRQVNAAPWAEPLVSAEGGPLLLAGELAGRRIAALTFDLFDSDLPLKIEWPILLANLTEWYRAPRAVRVEGSLSPGQTAVIQPLPETDSVRVTRPDGGVSLLRADAPLLIYADTRQSGIYSVDLLREGDVIRQEAFTVNLFDGNEGRIAVRTPDVGEGALAQAGEAEIGQQEFWPWIALAGLALLALEWFAYHRRLRAPTLRPRPESERRFARRA